MFGEKTSEEVSLVTTTAVEAELEDSFGREFLRSYMGLLVPDENEGLCCCWSCPW